MDSELLGVILRLRQRSLTKEATKEWLAQHIWRLHESQDFFDKMGVGELDLAIGAIDRGEAGNDELYDVAGYILEAAGFPTEFEVGDAPVDAELAAAIRYYVDGKLTLEQLEAAVTPRLAAYRRRLSPFDRMLARELELAFGMHAAQMASEDSVRSLLAALLSGLNAGLTPYPLPIAA